MIYFIVLLNRNLKKYWYFVSDRSKWMISFFYLDPHQLHFSAATLPGKSHTWNTNNKKNTQHTQFTQQIQNKQYKNINTKESTDQKCLKCKIQDWIQIHLISHNFFFTVMKNILKNNNKTFSSISVSKHKYEKIIHNKYNKVKAIQYSCFSRKYLLKDV